MGRNSFALPPPYRANLDAVSSELLRASLNKLQITEYINNDVLSSTVHNMCSSSDIAIAETQWEAIRMCHLLLHSAWRICWIRVLVGLSAYVFSTMQ